MGGALVILEVETRLRLRVETQKSRPIQIRKD